MSYSNAIPEKPNRLMLFDLALGGHHGSYIRHLMDYWCKTEMQGNIDIVVLPQFLTVHADAVEAIAKHQNPQIKFVAITPEEAATLRSRNSGINRISRNFQEWDLFSKYAKTLGSTQALMMYIDVYEMPLTFGKRSPCPFSGIFFRPTIHYSEFADYTPTSKDRIQQWREQLTLSRILRHPQLRTLFCLDPFAIAYIQKFPSKAKVVHLSDPVEGSPIAKSHSTDLRKRLGIDSDRQVFLLFGALDGRKGIYQLLEALKHLSEDLCRKFCLLLVGGTNPDEQQRIQSYASSICRSLPIQIVECYNFVHEDEVPEYFQMSDIVLAPYQRHVGMSGILLLAAVAGKPVLSSNYGLMGELVRRYQLGLSVDSTMPVEIAKALERCLLEAPENLGDRDKMQDFARQNSVDHYTTTIFKYLEIQ